MVRVKTCLNGDYRRFTLSDEYTFATLRDRICSNYGVDAFVVKYVDEDGDHVTVTRDDELHDAIADLPDGHTLRLHITTPSASKPPAPPGSAQSHAPRTLESPHALDADDDTDADPMDAPPTRPTAEQMPEPVAQLLEKLFGLDSLVNTAPSGRLDMHAGVVCDGCDCHPIVGTRYQCTSEPNYDLCTRCHSNDALRGNRTYRAVKYPWQTEPGRLPVPRPTLAHGSTGAEVMFLQHLMTRLGYMTPDDYAARAGVYGPRTADAVARLRHKAGLGFGVYDVAAACALLALLGPEGMRARAQRWRMGWERRNKPRGRVGRMRRRKKVRWRRDRNGTLWCSARDDVVVTGRVSKWV